MVLLANIKPNPAPGTNPSLHPTNRKPVNVTSVWRDDRVYVRHRRCRHVDGRYRERRLDHEGKAERAQGAPERRAAQRLQRLEQSASYNVVDRMQPTPSTVTALLPENDVLVATSGGRRASHGVGVVPDSGGLGAGGVAHVPGRNRAAAEHYGVMTQARYGANPACTRRITSRYTYGAPTEAQLAASYITTVSPVTYNGEPVVLSASPDTDANYPDATQSDAFAAAASAPSSPITSTSPTSRTPRCSPQESSTARS